MKKKCGKINSAIEQYFAEGPGIDAAHQKALRDIHLGKKQEGSTMNKSRYWKKTVGFLKGESMMKQKYDSAKRIIITVCTVFLLMILPVQAKDMAGAKQGSDADLAQELSNPVADLITIPVQINYDRGIGHQDNGWKLQTNIQPVIPFAVNDDWNLITRTIMPVIYQDDILPGSGSDFGLGDINMSLFFSPKEPTSGGVIWGAGPVLLFPTATESLLGGKKWGAGPALVVLTMRGQWTLGMLANHIWSYAGDSDRQDISNTFVQPFVAYTTPSAWTYSVQSETTYNWETEKWSVPVNFSVAKLVRWGKLPVSLQAGVGYWFESPDSGPEGFRFRFQANFVLPKSIFN